MKNMNLRVLLAAVSMVSILAGFTKVSAGPIRFNEVVQIVNARPGHAESTTFSRLALIGSIDDPVIGGDDDDKKKKDGQVQDGRVITETHTDIVDDDYCDCDQPHHGGFPKWALLGLAAIPIAFIIIKHKKDTPTPTPTTTITMTPTATTTPTTTPTVTPTPPMTPTPTPPETVPEPITILLFGTGLASVGLAARRRLSGKGEKTEEDSE